MNGMDGGRIVGIDLGTTNSLVACVSGGVPSVIRDSSGDALMPSVVSIDRAGTVYVGREAQRRLLTEAGRTAYSIKRFMGKGIEDVRDEARHLPFHISGDAVVKIGLGERAFTPPELSAFVLRELKHRAEAFFTARGDADPSVDRAVVTVPAYFNDAQRTATRDAGRIAGLDVVRIINEPTAACLAYGLDRKRTGVIAVYDLGGGTFDISILRVEDQVFQVLATNGDTHLGGDDIDVRLMDFVLQQRPPESYGTPEARQELRRAVIQGKWDLSELDDTSIDGMTLSLGQFETLIAPIVERTVGPCRQAMADANVAPSEIDEVVLVGGSTRIPLVRRIAEQLFGRKPHTDLNPDEVVALGAAVQADILMTGNRTMLLLDVTPLSLGIETMGGATSKIITRNSPIPATGSEIFTTGVDNQTAVDIHVVQGERELVQDNRSLARFKLRGIPPMAAGLPRVQVHFQIDADGILSVTASELRTQVEQTIEVKPSYGLTDEEVERMLLDSFEHAEADFEARLLIDARNEAETVILATEKSLRHPDFAAVEREQFAQGERQKIESIVAGLKMVMGSRDRETIQKWTKALNDATGHLAEIMINRSVQAALAGKHIDDA